MEQINSACRCQRDFLSLPVGLKLPNCSSYLRQNLIFEKGMGRGGMGEVRWMRDEGGGRDGRGERGERVVKTKVNPGRRGGGVGEEEQ